MASDAMECPYCHQDVVPTEGPHGRLRCPSCLNTGHLQHLIGETTNSTNEGTADTPSVPMER